MPIDYLHPNPDADCDTECWPNYWSIGFMDDDDRIELYELFDGHPLNRKGIANAFRKYRVFTFNGNNYDIPMILYAMKGATNEELKRLNDILITPNREERVKVWEVMDNFNLVVPDWLDHVDLFNVAPSAAQKASLKKYAGMMHSKHMIELPFPHDKILTRKDIGVVRSYHGNDMQVNRELRHELRPQIQLRCEISERYGLDFRSKSDAQCGEAVVKHLVEAQLPRRRDGAKQRIYKPDKRPGHKFFYEAPAYVKFKTPYMEHILSELLRSPFRINAKGYVEPPAMFGKKKGVADEEGQLINDGETYEGGSSIIIGEGVYKMGLGGLHSQEKKVSYYETPFVKIKDRDVTSYYPWLMINSGREPENMKGFFRKIFKALVLERVRAKKEASRAAARGDKKAAAHWKGIAEALKIFINGLFGKTGSPYSIVYSPEMMIQTTVTGQLSMLMLIEQSTLLNFKVISANTDGFVTLVPDDRRLEFEAMVFDWECESGLTTEETAYRSLHSRDVNNYIALKWDGKGGVEVKRKGAYAPSGRGIPAAMGLKKTPDVEVCTDAVIAFLLDGTPVESTVRNCQDIRKFVTVRQVRGGGEKNGEYIAKTVRYYIADDNPGAITYKTSGNNVPSSEGAEPCMTLPDELPRNIDYEWYEREAWAILDDMGIDVPDPTLAGRKGFVLGCRDDQKTLHTINAATGVALCGARRKSRREMWNEFKTLPDGMRSCAKCRKALDL